MRNCCQQGGLQGQQGPPGDDAHGTHEAAARCVAPDAGAELNADADVDTGAYADADAEAEADADADASSVRLYSGW